ncbi:hypothetical protein SLEP1_g16604 [Rubroshorea leprosula]|uniref:Integrase catalytic domain-containing protein n=1 Tax=Rubroshorea leprosula TaxID=152421 RepID=A0AAV5J0H3_9ROSI|nr:hypothetical protein SLEP1_g16604 [Rubroshorea leprosula]
MVRTFTGGRPPRHEVDEQDDAQVSEPGLNDYRPMPRNLFVGGAEQDHLSETDDERTPTGYATQPEQFQVPTGTRQRPSRPHNSQHERPERRWYHKLPRHSIDSYSQLAKLFSNKFASQREIKRTATELMQVHQKEGESLRDYMQRFNKATLDIDNVPDTICLSALLHGLKPGRFLDDLLENPPKSWNEVNDRSASFILFEDFQSSKRRADDRHGKELKQPENRDDKKKQKVGEQRGKPPSYPKYDSYIPLSSPRSQILSQIQHWVKRPPPQTHDSSRADRSKYCDYHRVYGHNIEDCQSLKDELEFLARNGKLEGYVQKPFVRQPTQTHFVQEYGRPQAPGYQLGSNPNSYQTALRSFCNDYGIELSLTSVYTPQSNGQAESANKIVLRGLKTRVIAARSNWVDELNKVLWSCRTTPNSATGETPFSLAYGAEAVIPVEVGLPSIRSDRQDDQNNGQLLRENLDLVEEVRQMARIKNMAHQSRVAKFYNKRVRARQFQVGDLVLRKAGLTNAYSHMGKLAPNWEGPYMVINIKRPGCYQLADLQGRPLSFIWNIHNLRNFYS